MIVSPPSWHVLPVGQASGVPLQQVLEKSKVTEAQSVLSGQHSRPSLYAKKYGASQDTGVRVVVLVVELVVVVGAEI